MNKRIIIIAGPNGAGKTTFARSFLPEEAQCPHFINADLIAAGVQRGESFAFETTLSGLGYRQHIGRWRSLGYQVSIYFLALPSVEAAIGRVVERVRQGGHDIPEPVIRRRFIAGLRNFHEHYKPWWMSGPCTTIPARSRCCLSGEKTHESPGSCQGTQPRAARIADCHAAGGCTGAQDRHPDRHRSCDREGWEVDSYLGRPIAPGCRRRDRRMTHGDWSGADKLLGSTDVGDLRAAR